RAAPAPDAERRRGGGLRPSASRPHETICRRGLQIERRRRLHFQAMLRIADLSRDRAELRLIGPEIDDRVVRIAEDAARVLARLHGFDRLLHHAAQDHDALVALTQMLARTVGDRALAVACRVVLVAVPNVEPAILDALVNAQLAGLELRRLQRERRLFEL